MTRLPALLLATSLAAAFPGGTVARAGAAESGCPAYNPPSALVLTAGTPQSAQLGSPFLTNFRVDLAAANSCPITTPLAGVPVTFTAPIFGPSGTFAGSGASSVLVGTDDSGAASAPTFTANTSAGGYLVVASSPVGSVVFSVVNTAAGVPASITARSPSTQSTGVGARFAQALTVEVADSSGKPVPGVDVVFSVGAGAMFEAGGADAQETTDASGEATSPGVVAGQVAGTTTATASVAGIVAPARFTLVAHAIQPRVSIVGGATLSATVGGHYARRLVVRVRDGGGRTMAGETVTFSLGPGAGFVDGGKQATATTDSRGVAASPRLTAGTVAGSFRATATTMSGGIAVFSLRNRAGAPTAVVAGAAADEATEAGLPFPIRLAVTVTDRYGNAVPGVLVAFAAPRHGPSARFAGSGRRTRARTDAHGVAIAPVLVADRTVGGYVVRASTAGHSAAFGLVNEPARG